MPGLACCHAAGSASSHPSSADHSNMPMLGSRCASAESRSWLSTVLSSSPALDMHQIWLLARAIVVLLRAAQASQDRCSRSSSMLTSSLDDPRPALRLAAPILYLEPLVVQNISSPLTFLTRSHSASRSGLACMASWHMVHCSRARVTSWATPRIRLRGCMYIRQRVMPRLRWLLPF